MWHWYGMGWWGWLMMVAFWVLVALLVIWAVRTNSPPTAKESPLRILEERFARGEIDSDEYEARRAVLETRR